MLTMAEHTTRRFMIAAPQGVADKLTGILAGAQIEPDAVVHTGAEALAALEEEYAVMLVGWRLPDMTGPELACAAGEKADMLMIVPKEFDAQAAGCGHVLTLVNPISQDALAASVRTMLFCSGKMQAMKKKADKLSRMLEERKIIERAKGKLMDALHLSESEAHYRMQKKSMDSGRRIIDVAREILEGRDEEAPQAEEKTE